MGIGPLNCQPLSFISTLFEHSATRLAEGWCDNGQWVQQRASLVHCDEIIRNRDISDLLLCDACNICCLIQSHVGCTEVQLEVYSWKYTVGRIQFCIIHVILCLTDREVSCGVLGFTLKLC